LAAVKAVTLIKQGTLMNWRRYRKALLPTGERRGIRVVRLIHHDREAIAGGFHINLQAERGTGRQRMNPQPEDTSKPKSWKNVLDSVAIYTR